MKNESIVDQDSKDSADIATLLNQIALHIEAQIPEGRTRFIDFEKQFNEYFVHDAQDERANPDKAALSVEFKRGVAYLSIHVFFGVPLLLFFVGQNSAALVELHGMLERQVLQTVPVLLSRNKLGAKIIGTITERRNLAEWGDVLRKLDVWTEDDVRFIRKLATIRNGIVHKNAKLISKHLNGGKPLEMYQIDFILDQMDCIPFFLRVLDLQAKLVYSLSHVSWPTESSDKSEPSRGAWTSSYWEDPKLADDVLV